MQVEIINENDTNWTATIKFTHNDVVHEETYNLIDVIPGTDLQLKKAGISFDQTMKSNVISKLKEQVKREIEEGILTNKISPPVADTTDVSAPETVTQ